MSEKKDGGDDDSRRDFLKTVGIGGLTAGIGAVAAVPAVAFVGYPLVHATTSGGGDFVVVGKRRGFKPGKPVKVEVFEDKRDAWNRVLQVKVGSAWVVDEGGELKAYTTVCPHLGCAIDWEGDDGKFKCPCHKSEFTAEGKVEDGPSPRGMDTLEIREKDGLIAIKYVRFKQGIGEKESV